MCTAAPSSRTSMMRTPCVREIVPDRLDVAALQPVHAVDAARDDELGDPLGDCPSRIGIHVVTSDRCKRLCGKHIAEARTSAASRGLPVCRVTVPSKCIASSECAERASLASNASRKRLRRRHRRRITSNFAVERLKKGVPRLCRAALILNLSSRGSPAGAFRRFRVGAHTGPLWRGNLANLALVQRVYGQLEHRREH